MSVNNSQEDFNSRDNAHIELTHILHYYLNQDDGSTIIELLREYSEYPKEILDYLQFIIIDDGSPIHVDFPTDLNINLLVLRITEDIAWNQPGCRNLGLTYSRSDKVLLTDIDHSFPVETMQKLIKHKNPGKTFYKFRRYKNDGTLIKTHPNTFFMSRARCLKYYGYDEDFSGSYGYDDSMLWRWQRNHGTRFVTMPLKYPCTSRKIDLDNAYHSLERNADENKDVAEKKREDWKKYGPARGHSRRFLCFNWDIVCDLYRESEIPEPPIQKFWIKNWHFRNIWPT
ncbi:MAG: glycosyltransferase family 2 protein [Lentisphaeria bacterium]|nr:glycosyltransferase [Lentisphaeria bacterium]NQZ66801.1 glycosyltransferase family 2 protein [Lentisphaeria bacterium]